ncbi:NADH-quinone oxidoreductase subunit J [Novosphingobium sp.]|uniref:NADH-quinone oxidoreductase subunit J n=1 Tax=Novosphingobium sp. TaxID=1874826 RepID=UPI00286C2EAB|nr:NADH-quinone oxidoreductase subunit J [Novosphingobium sp.]
MITALAFYLFATFTVISGAVTILSRNPVHSVLWLICAFFNAAGLMVLLGAEFIAMLLVIVYVGAVAVLFLFVVMMLNVDFSEMRAGFIKNFPLGLLLAAVLLGEIVVGLGAVGQGGIKLGVADGSAAPLTGQSNIEAIGMLLYGKYLFLFEAAGILLLVAMVGAIVLTHRKRPGVRGQSVPRQNARRPDEATVNMSPEVGAGVKL